MKILRKSLRVFLLFCLIFGLLGSLPLYAQQKKAKEVLEKVSQRWKEIKDFQADLVIGMEMMDSWMTIESKVWTKGDKFRMEMDVPFPEGVTNKVKTVFDGQTIWQYMSLQNVATKIDFTSLMKWAKEKGLEEEIKILRLKQPFFLPPDVDYKVSKKKKEGKVYYLLETEAIPSKMLESPEFKTMDLQFIPKKMVFWIGKDDFFPFRYELYSQKGTLRMWMEVRNVKIDTGIGDKDFLFQPPSGVQITDITEMIKEIAESFPKMGE